MGGGQMRPHGSWQVGSQPQRIGLDGKPGQQARSAGLAQQYIPGRKVERAMCAGLRSTSISGWQARAGSCRQFRKHPQRVVQIRVFEVVAGAGIHQRGVEFKPQPAQQAVIERMAGGV